MEKQDIFRCWLALCGGAVKRKLARYLIVKLYQHMHAKRPTQPSFIVIPGAPQGLPLTHQRAKIQARSALTARGFAPISRLGTHFLATLLLLEHSKFPSPRRPSMRHKKPARLLHQSLREVNPKEGKLERYERTVAKEWTLRKDHI